MSVRATPSGQPAGGATPPSPAVSAKGAHQAQHTPGPWVVDGPASYMNPNMGLWSVEGKTNVANHCTLADAHLIAAAPELLKEAQNAMDALIATDVILHRNGMMVGVDHPVIEPLRAALAKARGEAA